MDLWIYGFFMAIISYNRMNLAFIVQFSVFRSMYYVSTYRKTSSRRRPTIKVSQFFRRRLIDVLRYALV